MFQGQLDLFGEIKYASENKRSIPDVSPAHLYPSGASVAVVVNGAPTVIGGCNRKQWLQLKYEKSSDTGYVSEDIGPAEIGNLLQDYVEKELFAKTGLYLQNELRIYLPQWNVSGRIDTILRKETYMVPVDRGHKPLHLLQPGDNVAGQAVKTIQYFGVEIKSKSGYQSEGKFIRAKKTANPRDFRPADDHILQAMTYLYACRTIPNLQQYKITRWFIFYVLREDGRYNYFEVDLTDFDSEHGFGYPIIYSSCIPQGFIYKRFGMNDVIKRWEELNFCADYNILPDRDYSLAYSPAKQMALLASEDNELSKANKELIAEGKYNQTVVGKGTVNERPLGDFECYVCPFKSKCWGLAGHEENDFEVTKPGNSLCKVKYSQFKPVESQYFEKLDDKAKQIVTEESRV